MGSRTSKEMFLH
uniref:Uncharacterized protein n=1 Tax=Rhizophora mucronata TaxID=61149 RepID=A0A2P2P9H0_RHIMU